VDLFGLQLLRNESRPQKRNLGALLHSPMPLVFSMTRRAIALFRGARLVDVTTRADHEATRSDWFARSSICSVSGRPRFCAASRTAGQRPRGIRPRTFITRA
jgi:hypothetical protein